MSAYTTVACLTCGSTFTTTQSRREQGRGKYCSSRCKYKRHGREPSPNADGSYSVPLTKGYTAIVDADDVERVNRYSWSAIERNGIVYAVANIGGKITGMHQFITGSSSGMVTDHIDGDQMNNRRDNLRICTQADNIANSSKRTGSLFKGVTRLPSGRFACRVANRHVGVFATAEDAARAYDAEAVKTFGEFARINFPKKGAA